MSDLLFYLLIAALGIVCLYLLVRLSSYAILQSINDVNRKRKEKNHGSTKGR